VFLRTQIVDKQRSSLVDPTIVTKLQCIRIKTELAYIGGRRTISFVRE